MTNKFFSTTSSCKDEDSLSSHSHSRMRMLNANGRRKGGGGGGGWLDCAVGSKQINKGPFFATVARDHRADIFFSAQTPQRDLVWRGLDMFHSIHVRKLSSIQDPLLRELCTYVMCQN